MKKTRLLPFLIFPLCLVSCGETGYSGTYSFQMGKTKGAHLLAKMTLTEDSYSNGSATGKKGTIYAEAKFNTAAKSSVSASEESELSSEEEILSYEEELSSEEVLSEDSAADSSSEEDADFESLSEPLMELLADGLELPVYYNVGAVAASGKNIFKLGFSLDSIFGEESGFYIEPEFVETIVYSEIDDKSVYLKFPVSMDDLTYQLYWYGLDLAIESGTSDAVEHDVNTHPTAEQIAEINKTYPSTHGGKKYRDFHTFSLSLIKE